MGLGGSGVWGVWDLGYNAPRDFWAWLRVLQVKRFRLDRRTFLPGLTLGPEESCVYQGPQRAGS